MRSFNFDSGTILNFNKTPQGYLKVRIRLTKPGVFTYNRGSFGIKKELRRFEELHNPKVMKSIECSIFTNEHPTDADGKPILVDQTNTKNFQIGYPASAPFVENGKYISIDAIITDDESIKDIETGKKRQISWGSTCSIDEKGGSWNGINYDWEQVNLESNHIALCKEGRLGSDVGIISSFDSIGINNEEVSTVIVKILGKDYEVADDLAKSLNQLVDESNRKVGDLESLVKGYKIDNAKLEASYDSLKVDFQKLKDSHTNTESQFKDKFLELRSIYDVAKKVLKDEEFKSLDSVDAAELKKRILSSDSSAIDFSKKNIDYIDARYDIFVENMVKSSNSENNRNKPIDRYTNADSVDAGSDKSKSARSVYIEKQRNLWKK